jgi:hypothetical protein
MMGACGGLCGPARNMPTVAGSHLGWSITEPLSISWRGGLGSLNSANGLCGIAGGMIERDSVRATGVSPWAGSRLGGMSFGD